MSKWLSKKEASELTGMCARSLDNYRERGLLPFAKVGKAVRFQEADLEKFMLSRRVSVREAGA